MGCKFYIRQGSHLLRVLAASDGLCVSGLLWMGYVECLGSHVWAARNMPLSLLAAITELFGSGPYLDAYFALYICLQQIIHQPLYNYIEISLFVD